jgi:hypothetical protein
LPDYNYGKFPIESMQIDGFLCVCDVTDVPRRQFQSQLIEIEKILTNLIKTKKPVILVTTKHDNFKAYKTDYLMDIERLLLKKEFTKTVHTQVIETSAHLNINVDLAFYQLALLINKSLNKYRSQLIVNQTVPKFIDAYEAHLAFIHKMKQFYKSLLHAHVNKYQFKYEQFYVIKKYELNQLIDLFGIDFILAKFNRHLDILKETHVNRKLNDYLNRLPSIVAQLYDNDTDKQYFLNNPWNLVSEHMKKQKLFDKFIVKSPSTQIPWYECDLFDANPNTMPYDLFLLYDKCQLVFDTYVRSLKDSIKVKESKLELFELLKANALKNNIQPGKQWHEAHVFLIGRECYEYLNDEQRELMFCLQFIFIFISLCP